MRQAIDLAERSAKLQLESVMVSISAGKPASELMSASVTVNGSTVADHDIARVMAAGSRHSARPGRAVLHSLPIGYTLDGVAGIREPRGMLGRNFGIDMHVMTAEMSVVRNLMYAIESCHIDVASMVASPYAAALSVLADDEGDLGAALIDMGAGTTTIAVFSGGRFVHGDGFALGGHHVTMDIARGLNTRIADAERIKTLYGSVLAGGSDERDMITVPPVDHDEHDAPQYVSRAQLVRIVKPRVEEILEMVARPPRGVAVRGGAARPRGADRRRLPAHRPARSRDADPRTAGPHRTAARHRRAAGGGEGTCFRGVDRLAGLSATRASRTKRTAANAALDDWNGRLFRTGRTMASRELLMTEDLPMQPVADRRDRRHRKNCDARAMKRQP